MNDKATDDTRMPLTTSDPLDERMEKLKELIPEAFAEGEIDFGRLRQALGDSVGQGRERYGLTWAGKADAIRAIQAPSAGTLVPCPEESVNFDTTENLFIEGDNLEVLKLLQKSYYGKVKMIYIDPPYNTGNEFIYPDNFKEGLEDYLKYSGQVGEGGVKLSTNTETSGRYHSKWLNMMYPRLFLARNLLRQDGVIFVSIDDHEGHNLRLLMDEVFGAENFVAHIVWQKRYVSNVTAKYLSDMHDHVLLYARQLEHVSIARLERSEEQLKAYKNPDNDPRGRWRAQDLSASKPYKAGQFVITTPAGLEVKPPPGRYWRCNKEQYDKWVADNRIWFGKDGDRRPMLKSFLSEAQKGGLTPNTWWSHKFAGHNKEATLELKDLFGGTSPFDTPKPVKLINRMLEISCGTDDIVLDFFAGSAPTAQAVLEQNQRDNGSRRFIMVQLPEPVEPDSSAGQLGFSTIAEVGEARTKKAIEKLASSSANTLDFDKEEKRQDLGFRVLRLTSSNFKVWDATGSPDDQAEVANQLKLFADHVLPGRSEQDILYELMLKAGLPLTAPVDEKTVADLTVYSIAGGLMMICLADEITQDVLRGMIELSPQRIVCLDAAFKGNDQLKTNTVLEMKSHDIEFRTV